MRRGPAAECLEKIVLLAVLVDIQAIRQPFRVAGISD